MKMKMKSSLLLGSLMMLPFSTSSYALTCGEVSVLPLSIDEVTVDCIPFVPPNIPPVANPDTAGPVITGVVVMGNVLDNDTDPDGGTLSVVQPAGPIQADGSFSFSSVTAGTFVFPYTATDPGGLTASSNLTITINSAPPPVNQPPVAVADSFNSVVGTLITGNILANDSDPNGDILSVSPRPNGPFFLTAQGVVSFTPTAAGTFAFNYSAKDPAGLTSNVVLVTFIVTAAPPPPVNNPPLAIDDSNSGQVNVAILGNVLTNDTDPDNDPLTVNPLVGPIQSNGHYSFTSPTAGSFPFTYIVNDGKGGSDTGVLTITVSAMPPPPPTTGLKAFPEAEGFGRNVSGGRGGIVMQVTNLNDAGAGSLRACVEGTGARTCVFRTSGTISINSKFTISSGNLTIAGQTAPGQGIAIKNGANLDKTFHVRAPNVMFRHIHIRPGPTLTPSDLVNCFGVETTKVMIDHVSCSWTTDQNMYVDPSNDITVQDSLFYEGLHKSTHTSAFHSKGTMFIGGGVSIIRNLIAANSTIRCPNLEGRNSAGATDYEVRNNITFNCVEDFFHLYNRSNNTLVDAVGNVAIKGPISLSVSQDFKATIYPMDIVDRMNVFGPSSGSHVCLQDNLAIGSFPADRLEGFLNPNDAHLLVSSDCYNNPVGRGMTAPAMPASQTEAYVLANAGAFPKHRDSADTRIVAGVAARQGALVDHPSQVGGWPVLATGTNYPDSDADGMDDGWEVANGVSNPSAIAAGHVYTNLERFINELALTR